MQGPYSVYLYSDNGQSNSAEREDVAPERHKGRPTTFFRIPVMNADPNSDQPADQIEQIADLADDTEAKNSEQVKGGFDPQPDPPCLGVPVFQPPVIRLGGSIR